MLNFVGDIFYYHGNIKTLATCWKNKLKFELITQQYLPSVNIKTHTITNNICCSRRFLAACCWSAILSLFSHAQTNPTPGLTGGKH